MHLFGALFQKTIAAAIMLFPSASVVSDEIVVMTPSGNSLTLEIDPEASFSQVLQTIETHLNEEAKPILIDFSGTAMQCKAAYKSQAKPRNYYAPVTDAEKENLRKLLKWMAKKTWAELLANSSGLNEIGDSIDHIHPLKFLQTIFISDPTDPSEEMKGCLHSIRDRTLIWKKFTNGLFDSLEEESKRNNMRPEFINDFCANLKLNPNLVTTKIQERKWKEFMDTLLTQIPRSGNPGHYNM